MADQKISQLPAATLPLAGTELLELVQAGINVQSTPNAITTLNPTPTPASVLTQNNNQLWTAIVTTAESGAIPTGYGSFTFGAANWTSNGAAVGIHNPNPAATTFFGAVGCARPQTGGAINQGAEVTNSLVSVGVGPATGMPGFRKLSGGLALAGFTFVMIGGFHQARADQTAFIGVGPQTNLGASGVPSASLNMVGFGKDQGDTNLQFMVNNGAGSAAKTDTGVTMASLSSHLFKVTITCDSLGALITATFQDLETGGAGTKQYTVADGATKNPVADADLQPRMYVGSGSATATLVGLNLVSAFFSVGMVQ